MDRPSAKTGQLAFDWSEIERSRLDPRAIFETTEVQRLLELREGQHFDRKSAEIKPQKLAETICAFANGDAKGGVIAIGIKDRQVEGFESAGPRKLNELIRTAGEFCPQAHVLHKTLRHGEAEILLLLVEYNPNRVVELGDRSVYLRCADSNRKLSPQDVVRLKQEKGEIPFELEPVETAGIADLDPELVREFAESVRSQDDLEFTKSFEDVLVQKRLGRVRGGRFEPFNVAILLLASDPIPLFPGCKIRFIRHEGTEERTGQELSVIKDTMIEGPVPRLIKRAEEVVFSQLRDFQALQPDGLFKLVPEYPADCVREAIVNACVHRSYSARNQPVFIRMFDDRLEVESPGGFVPPVTAENIWEQHVPRNPFLMDALRYMRFVRCANEGTRRMRHLMKSSGLPDPQFREESDRLSKVIVTLRNNVEQRKTWIDRDLSRHVGARLAGSLSKEEIRVLNHLSEFGSINVAHAHRITGVAKWHAAKKIMDGLVAKGLVTFVSSRPRDPNSHFVLADVWKKNGDH